MLNWQPSDEWLALQLTDEQVAEARKQSQANIDQARADGVYERFARLRGTVKFSMDYSEMKGVD